MGKIVFWIVVVVAVMLVMRMVNLSKARSRRDADRARAAPPPPTPAAMVRCDGCGVFLPRAEAREVAGRFRCGQPGCTAPHNRGH